METVTDFIFLGSKITEDSDCSQEIKRHSLLGRRAMTNLDSDHLASLSVPSITLPTQVHPVKAMGFPVVKYRWESWAIKKAECRELMLSNCGAGEDSWESPLDYKEIKPVNPKGNQSWIFIGRTDAEAETPILWAPDGKSQLIGKDSCWERQRAGEGSDRGWDGWMASPTDIKKTKNNGEFRSNFVKISLQLIQNSNPLPPFW